MRAPTKPLTASRHEAFFESAPETHTLERDVRKAASICSVDGVSMILMPRSDSTIPRCYRRYPPNTDASPTFLPQSTPIFTNWLFTSDSPTATFGRSVVPVNTSGHCAELVSVTEK